MMDTQETNLPKNDLIPADAKGKLEQSQAPEIEPVETVQEANSAEVFPEANVSETMPKEEADSTDAITEIKTDAEKGGIVPETDEPEGASETVEQDAVPETAEPDPEEKEAEPASKSDEGTLQPTDVTEVLPEETADAVVKETVEETPEEVVEGSPENEAAMIVPLEAVVLAAMTKADLLERMEQVVEEPNKFVRHEVDILKQAYYKLRRAETEAEKKAFLEGGGEELNFVYSEDETETRMKSLITKYKEKRAEMAADDERQKEVNLVLKQHMIERLKVLTESQDDFNKRYNEFRDIQKKWKEVKQIPQEYAKELWRNYQLYNERFYDLVKINNQFRDYDFKKNLEMKTALCETVERLTEEADVISAFHQLQKLHQQWREIGPVAKEFREAVWERFKAASTIINKRHQGHFETLKEQEEQNLQLKTSICEEIEAIDFDALKTMKDWERKTEEVIALQTNWRTIGFATKKQNVKIFERFRAACDHYFNKKSEFYKSIKQEMDKNLELKKMLVEKAESMKENTDWKETTKAFIEIQNEWKKIGPVARKHSEVIWKQFIAACDYFFEQKNKEVSSQKVEETENLKAKKELVEKINAISPDLSDEEALMRLREYMEEWNAIGFVPFKEKDKVYKLFREASDKQFDRLKVNERDRRIQQYRTNLTELAVTGKNKLYNERDKLMRVYERMKNELQTYENNIGFFNVSSKGGDGLLKEMDRKIERLKEDMDIIIKKIEAIDENLD